MATLKAAARLDRSRRRQRAHRQRTHSADSGALRQADEDLASLQGAVGNRSTTQALQQSDGAMRSRPGEALSSISSEQDETARRDQIHELAEWFRDSTPDEALLREYLGGPESAAAKTRVLGELMVLLARAQFLLGWAHQGGVAGTNRGSWEREWRGDRWRARQNRGTFVGAYQEAMGGRTGDMWCTQFVGTMAKSLGFEFNQDVSENARGSMFWSGYRLTHWARTGKSNKDRHQLNEQRPVDEGTTIFERQTWRSLKGALRRVPVGERAVAVSEFFTRSGGSEPQPGDVLMGGGGNGLSHTMMVESYDSATATIHTIEGNARNAVRSRAVHLTDFSHLEWMGPIVRIGAQNFAGFFEPSGPPQESEDVDDPDSTVPNERGEELIRSVREHVQKVAATLSSMDMIETDDADASTADWQGGDYDWSPTNDQTR